MTEDEQKALRALLREEVNAAVYASEQRLGEHFGGLGDRMDRFEGHLGRLDQRIDRVEDRLSQVEISQQKMQVDLSHVVAILNEVTKTINSIQAAQIALELKVEDNSRSLKRDMQNLTEIVHTFAYRFVEANGQTSERLMLHERTPIDHAHPRHPRPNSAT
jgi:DNA repair ATPase RecN